VSDERELDLAWQRHVGTSAAADAWFDTVIGYHRAPTRHYHGVRHIRWVVHHGRELAESTVPPLEAGDLDAVVAAAFFHDAVYDTSRSDNESASARLAARALGEIGWDRPAIEHVASMIEATANHRVERLDDAATSVLVAADLAVLAAEPAPYVDYTRAVRREYAHLDDEAWRSGRSAFIRTTLDSAHIFPSALGLDVWERRARANLSAELAALA
jgi:predicted metal-dependent HD superfamily phosphohydrolase